MALSILGLIFLGFPDYMRRDEASITWMVTFHGGGDTGKAYESLVNVNGVSIKTVHEASLKSFIFKYCGVEQWSARLSHKQEVVSNGSNPTLRINKETYSKFFMD